MLYSVLAIEYTSCDILLKVSSIIMDLLGSCYNFDFPLAHFISRHLQAKIKILVSIFILEIVYHLHNYIIQSVYTICFHIYIFISREFCLSCLPPKAAVISGHNIDVYIRIHINVSNYAYLWMSWYTTEENCKSYICKIFITHLANWSVL